MSAPPGSRRQIARWRGRHRRHPPHRRPSSGAPPRARSPKPRAEIDGLRTRQQFVREQIAVEVEGHRHRCRWRGKDRPARRRRSGARRRSCRRRTPPLRTRRERFLPPQHARGSRHRRRRAPARCTGPRGLGRDRPCRRDGRPGGTGLPDAFALDGGLRRARAIALASPDRHAHRR